MTEIEYVDFLTYLNVSVEKTDNSELMLLEAKGISENGQLGIPKLVPRTTPKDKPFDGLFEIDFRIAPSELIKRKGIDWNIRVVFDLNDLPEGIKCVKVNAAKNADIAMLQVLQ